MSVSQALRLRQKLDQSSKAFGSFAGLSPLELELLLDRSVEHPIRQDREYAGNSSGIYFFGGREFSELIREVKKAVPKESNLETPQILVRKTNDVYSAVYNIAIQDRISRKLDGLQKVEGDRKYIDSLIRQVTKEREWVVKTQVAIVNYICAAQSKYLESGNVLDLNPISQKDVGKAVGYSESTVSRLIRNLTIQMPESGVIFARDLIPGYFDSSNKGIFALRQLQNDPQLYENSEWKVSDAKLVPILRERFGIEVSRRTVTNYRSSL